VRTAAAPPPAAGNLCDKYALRNPLARALVARWRADLLALVTGVSPSSIVEFG
jgi:hypothetical protein